MTSLIKNNIRVIIDLQGYQRESNRVRGIGRYSIKLVKSFIRQYPGNTYILFSNSSLFDFRKDFLPELNDAQLNVIYFEWNPPGKINDDIFSSYSRNSVAKQIRSYALSLINADIVLLTSFFDGFKDNTLIDFDRDYQLPPVVAVIYDLIPLIMPEMYLNNDEEYRYFYYQKIKDLKNLDAILTISESAKNEIETHIKFDENRIFNISASFDDEYFYKDLKGNEDLSINVNDFGKYILCSSAADPRKNLFKLFKAYSMLPLPLINKHKLVLTGPFSVTEIELINFWLDDLNINPQNVNILGFVKDYDLANLYRNAYLFVFPSLHEGFGLPVLEAIICGAVVIASNATSIPEIVTYEPALFDPHNVENLKDLIIRSLTDSKFRNSILDNTSFVSSNFSWKKTADKMMYSICTILESKSQIRSNNKTILSYSRIIKENYNRLILNLKSNLFIKSPFFYNNYTEIVAASIALINDQIKKIYLSLQPDLKKMIWRIEGPFDSSYSLSILNKNFALALLKTGQEIELCSTEGPGDFTPSFGFLQNNPLINKLYEKSKNSTNDIFITSRNLYPPRVDDLDSHINLLHAYGWEESSFPAEWVDKFNKHLTGLTVMSNQVKKILIDNGVYLPIKVCGLGVDHIHNHGENYQYSFSKKEFSFLHISSCFPRKGIECLLISYGRSFSKSDDVSLIIKTFKNEHNNIEQILEKLYLMNPNFPDVNVIYSDLNEEEIISLYQQCDALVAPSHGEGFNLTVAEGMRLGLPVITTAWGGQMDFCNSENAWLIDYEFEYSKSHLSTSSSVWAKPSDIHLSQLLKDIYQAPSHILSSRINAAKQTISEYKWEKVVQKNQDFVLELCSSPPLKKPIIGVISTWKARCGIATYSEHLLSHIEDEYIIFSSKNCNKNQEDESIRCWNLGNDDLNELFECVLENNITSILIQFNYGFFDFNSFSHFLQRIHDNNIKTLVILHSTIDPEIDSTKKLELISDQLALCNRLLVHTPSDLNRLKKLGLIDNVTLFPHGILELETYERKNDFIKYTSQDLHFSTFGFCLPNKGFNELIQAIKILHNENIICRLTLYTSLYDASISHDLLRKLRSLINDLKLTRYVQIDPSFLDDDEIYENLSNTDLVIFPYQSTNESASGAVRQGISSHAPVAVTPVPIFDDVLDVVYQLPGCSPSSIANGLIKWINEFYGLPMNTKEINWRKQHSFKLLACRLQGLIRSLEIND